MAGVNMKKHIIAPLLLWCLASTAWADTIQLQENHPDRYVVVKGDTLWGISGRFLKDPWQWPQVWKMNREQIRNPHLIYPGDVVVLDMSGGTPRLRVLHETVVVEPGAVVEPLAAQAIPTIPPSVIAPFLSQPLMVTREDLDAAPRVLGTEDSRLLIGNGMHLYADKVEDGDGLAWQVFRPGKPLIDPDTKKELGVEAIYLGEAKTLHYGQPATLEMARMKQDVNKGDRLIPPSPSEMKSFAPRAPEGDIKGRIISTYDGPNSVGRNYIVAINRGASEGLEPGHVLAIHKEGATVPTGREDSGPRQGYVRFERNEDGTIKRDEQGRAITRVGTESLDGKVVPKEVKLPDERTGLLMVFKTFEHVSYALVMQSTRQIQAMDVVTTP
jgi:hypothetical protein